MINKKISDLNPKIWQVLLISGLVTYFIQIVATVTGEILRGNTDWGYTVIGWLADLSVPAIAFLIGLILSKWRRPKDHIRFAAIFTICTFLLCLIGQTLLPYVNEIWGPWDMLIQYTMPAIIAIILQTLVSVSLILRQDKSERVANTQLYIIILSFIALAGQVVQTLQIIPFIIRVSINANPFDTFIFPLILTLWLVAPVVIFAKLIVINNARLNTIKSASQRLFLACLISVYAFVIARALFISVGIVPLHDIANLWICIAGYLVALIVDGIIIHRIRVLSV
jgi:hypothetical protein